MLARISQAFVSFSYIFIYIFIYMYMLLTSTFILILYNNSAALTSIPNIISSVNIAPKRGMPLDYIYIYICIYMLLTIIFIFITSNLALARTSFDCAWRKVNNERTKNNLCFAYKPFPCSTVTNQAYNYT